ncbi:hypothetical protein [Vibrio breoganii]|nr:hypothetical protein [Vibrio breoganii]
MHRNLRLSIYNITEDFYPEDESCMPILMLELTEALLDAIDYSFAILTHSQSIKEIGIEVKEFIKECIVEHNATLTILKNGICYITINSTKQGNWRTEDFDIDRVKPAITDK